MNINSRRIVSAGLAAGLGLLLMAGLAACVAGIGYGGDVRATYLGGYYEPYGYEYGGWQNGYRVGPPRGDEHRGQEPGSHPYRAAPPARSVPSIPRRSRGPDLRRRPN